MLEEIKYLRVLLLKTERKLRELMWSKDFKQKSELLRSIPGIGPLTALLFLLEVGDITRFKNFDALNRFVGLCPDSHSSAEREKHTGLSDRRHNALRSALVEASWLLIRRDAAMLEHYKELQKRVKGQQAIIRIARKLLRRIRAVLLSERMYVRGVEGAVSSQQIEAPCLPAPKQKGRSRKVELEGTSCHRAE
jgi:transposase